MRFSGRSGSIAVLAMNYKQRAYMALATGRSQRTHNRYAMHSCYVVASLGFLVVVP